MGIPIGLPGAHRAFGALAILVQAIILPAGRSPMALVWVTAVIIQIIIGGTTIGATAIITTTDPLKEVIILRAMKRHAWSMDAIIQTKIISLIETTTNTTDKETTVTIAITQDQLIVDEALETEASIVLQATNPTAPGSQTTEAANNQRC